MNAPLTFWVLQVYPNLGYGRIGPGVRIAMVSTGFACRQPGLADRGGEGHLRAIGALYER